MTWAELHRRREAYYEARELVAKMRSMRLIPFRAGGETLRDVYETILADDEEVA